MTRFQAVDDGRNGTDIISHREEDEFLIDELGIGDLVRVVIKVGAGLDSRQSGRSKSIMDERYPELTEPFLSVVRLLFAECHVDQAAVILFKFAKRDHVFGHVAKVRDSVRVLARS